MVGGAARSETACRRPVSAGPRPSSPTGCPRCPRRGSAPAPPVPSRDHGTCGGRTPRPAPRGCATTPRDRSTPGISARRWTRARFLPSVRDFPVVPGSPVAQPLQSQDAEAAGFAESFHVVAATSASIKTTRDTIESYGDGPSTSTVSAWSAIVVAVRWVEVAVRKQARQGNTPDRHPGPPAWRLVSASMPPAIAHSAKLGPVRSQARAFQSAVQ